jgi:amidohydrolase
MTESAERRNPGGESLDMDWTEVDVSEVTAFRHRLHEKPELSGEEELTAREVVRFLLPTKPDEIITSLGGHGVALVFESGVAGPTVMLRSELDGLPIEERTEVPHLCGHDGHSATLALIARALQRQRPRRGRIVLMFQPAEEDGTGARAVLADPRFAAIRPDISFSYHNYPGVPLGVAWIADGVANCASRGMRICFSGKSSHASQPEKGVSPMTAMAELMPALRGLSNADARGDAYALATITHATLGAPAFGITPGEGEIWATLRTLTDDRMAALLQRAEALARKAAADHGLKLEISHDAVFAHCENAPEAVTHLQRAMDDEGMPYSAGELPLRASEDFGMFGKERPSAMVFIGAGEAHPSLHNPDYDFPDALLPIAARVLLRAARQVTDAP